MTLWQDRSRSNLVDLPLPSRGILTSGDAEAQKYHHKVRPLRQPLELPA